MTEELLSADYGASEPRIPRRQNLLIDFVTIYRVHSAL